MTNFLIKIKDRVKKIIPFRKLNPLTYWDNLLRIFFIIVIGLIIFSFYLLYQIKHQQIFQIKTDSTNGSHLINEKLLDKVMELFESKKTRTEEIKNTKEVYKDPSIS
jgi:hypothetical protein